MSLYDDLELPPDASPEDIKRAYRKKAQKAHPDRPGGDPAKFQLIQRAYDILGDEAKRKRYDSGVNVEEPNLKQMAMQNLAMLFMNLINSSSEIDALDIMPSLRATIKDGEGKAKQSIKHANASIKRYEKAKKKLKFKGKGDSFLLNVLNISVQQAQQKIVSDEQMLEVAAEMKKILEEHDWEVAASSGSNPLRSFLSYGDISE